jgi:hypothetical protein
MKGLNAVSETLSLTPRPVAVKKRRAQPETVSTVFLPVRMFFSMTFVRLTANSGLKSGGGKLLKQFPIIYPPLSPRSIAVLMREWHSPV